MADANERPLGVHLVHQSFGDYVEGLIDGITAEPAGAGLEVTTVSSGAAFYGRLRSAPEGHRHVELPRFRDPRSAPLALAAVRRIVRQPCDVIHWQAAGNPWVDAAFSTQMGRRPTVVTVHDMEPHPGDRNVLPGAFTAIRRVARRADRLIVHAPHIADQAVAAGVDRSRIVVMAHGELATRYRPASSLPLDPAADDPPVVLFFGRAQGYKGLDLLVEAMRLLNAERTVATLVIAGAGQSLDELFPAHRSVPRWCELHRGHIPNERVVELFGRASVVALPYREASQSGVAALAAGFGRPVVASSVPGLRDIVEDGETGVLVEPNDARALAAALADVAGDEDLGRRLGGGAYAAATGRLAWPNIAGELREIYEQVAASARAPRSTVDGRRL